MTSLVWVSGASSGIGAAFAAATPYDDARVIGISRRPPSSGEHLEADLAEPASWDRVGASFVQGLREPPRRAVFFHCAGTNAAAGPATDADPDEYASAVLLNAAAGQILGQRFLAAAGTGTEATLIVCSSPASEKQLSGLSHYCGGKAALEHWACTVAAEQAEHGSPVRVITVVPHVVDTPLLREMLNAPVEDVPLSRFFRETEAAGLLVTPEQAAREIWAAVEAPVEPGAIVHVGNVDITSNVRTNERRPE